MSNLQDVKPHLQQQLGKGVLLAPDGARAWPAALKDSDIPVVPGVNHNRKIFTPLAALPDKDDGRAQTSGQGSGVMNFLAAAGCFHSTDAG